MTSHSRPHIPSFHMPGDDVPLSAGPATTTSGSGEPELMSDLLPGNISTSLKEKSEGTVSPKQSSAMGLSTFTPRGITDDGAVLTVAPAMPGVSLYQGGGGAGPYNVGGGGGGGVGIHRGMSIAFARADAGACSHCFGVDTVIRATETIVSVLGEFDLDDINNSVKNPPTPQPPLQLTNSMDAPPAVRTTTSPAAFQYRSHAGAGAPHNEMQQHQSLVLPSQEQVHRGQTRIVSPSYNALVAEEQEGSASSQQRVVQTIHSQTNNPCCNIGHNTTQCCPGLDAQLRRMPYEKLLAMTTLVLNQVYRIRVAAEDRLEEPCTCGSVAMQEMDKNDNNNNNNKAGGASGTGSQFGGGGYYLSAASSQNQTPRGGVPPPSSGGKTVYASKIPVASGGGVGVSDVDSLYGSTTSAHSSIHAAATGRVPLIVKILPTPSSAALQNMSSQNNRLKTVPTPRKSSVESNSSVGGGAASSPTGGNPPTTSNRRRSVAFADGETNNPPAAPATTAAGVDHDDHARTGALKARKSLIMSHTVSEETDDVSGFEMVNQYLLMEEVGAGTSGVVYAVCDTEVNQDFAMKVIKRDRFQNRRASIMSTVTSGAHQAPSVMAVNREVAIMKKLRHPHVVRLHEVIDDPTHNKLYLVMQLLTGGRLCPSLDTATGACEPVDATLLRRYVYQICDGLRYLHQHNIIHRDVKPENMMLDADGNVVLVDFGVSEVAVDDAGLVEGAIGTPAFMAPEVWDGDKVCGAAADVWSLGVSVFMMLTGRSPFPATTKAELIEQVRSREPVFPDGVDPAWRSLLRGMLNKDPETRISLSAIVRHAMFAEHRPGRRSGKSVSVSDSIHEFRNSSSAAMCASDSGCVTRGPIVVTEEDVRRAIAGRADVALTFEDEEGNAVVGDGGMFSSSVGLGRGPSFDYSPPAGGAQPFGTSSSTNVVVSVTPEEGNCGVTPNLLSKPHLLDTADHTENGKQIQQFTPFTTDLTMPSSAMQKVDLTTTEISAHSSTTVTVHHVPVNEPAATHSSSSNRRHPAKAPHGRMSVVSIAIPEEKLMRAIQAHRTSLPSAPSLSSNGSGGEAHQGA